MEKNIMEKGHGKGLYTILGEGTHFEGSLSVPHNLNINGYFYGKIETAELITVGQTGMVKAEIKAKNAIVAGQIQGNLMAEDRVELEKNSTLIGDLRTRELIINEGALFHGNCSMVNEKQEKV
jgi:cytoskeletal protein CcmA (bactofilin family)